MASNKSLSNRNRSPTDDFYTQLVDIEAELRHYRDQFRGTVVLCNCDDPYESNFFKYFAMNFNHLGLKKLITTCYAGSPVSGQQLPLFETAGLRDTQPPREPYRVEISEVPDLNQDGAIDLADVEYLLRNDANVMTPLTGDGDFRSMDYDGAMGVPITFLDRYNPEQFEILGSSRLLSQPMSNHAERGTYMQGGPRFYVPGGNGTHRRLYDRIVIRRIGRVPA